MKNRESRRIVPISVVTIVVFAVVVVFEALIIGGVYEVKASAVARIAPWAYEPFLKLVGEHPDSPNMHISLTQGVEAKGASAMAGASGSNPATSTPAAGTNATTNSLLLPIMMEQPAETTSTNEPPQSEPVQKEVVPVG